MTDPVNTNEPEPCQWIVPGPDGSESAADECGRPATTHVWDQVDDTVRAVCDDHHARAVADGWTTTGPELPAGQRPTPGGLGVALAEIDALVDAMHGAKGTADAKANHVRDQLAAAGWGLHQVDGGPVVVLGPDQQVVTVPDGATVSVHPYGEHALYGPAVAGDDELGLLAVVCHHLDRLDPDARERLVDYLDDRYSPSGRDPQWTAISAARILSAQVTPGRDGDS